MNCPNCGSELPEDATFCTNCGANIGGEDSGAEPEKATPETEQIAEQEAEPSPPADEPTSEPAQRADVSGEDKPFFKQWYGILLIIIIVLVLLCCCCSCIGAVFGGSMGYF
ncbi:MAG: zinc-ribbon domain-containing protein [bacterium]|nr:zinc-ribbon domain-containing protein [bacterium]